MNADIRTYNSSHSLEYAKICEGLMHELNLGLPKASAKLYHRAPVWFLDGNPIAGYFVRKDAVQLLFWSGQSFDEKKLQPTGSFKAAELRYTSSDEIDKDFLQKILKKAHIVQWDYKNIVKRRGQLIRIETKE